MKKIVSIALFGENHEKYAQYLKAFVRAHANIYPVRDDWWLNIYLDTQVCDGPVGELVEKYERAGLLDADVCFDEDPLTKAMLWRMFPVFDKTVDFVFCRDLDAMPMPRDRACMDTFMHSGCVVHTIHDNQAHTGIMGGLCGFHAPKLRAHTGWESLSDLYKAAGVIDAEYKQHGMDQIVLNRLLNRAEGPTLLEHRYNGWAGGLPGVNNPRNASVYRCRAFSTPVTNKIRPGDGLGAHLGCAGYDHEAAVKFWDENGDPSIAKLVRECEA